MQKEKFLKVFMVMSILFMLMPAVALAEKIPVAILRTNADGKTKTLTFTYAERPKVFAKRGRNGIHKVNVGYVDLLREWEPTWIKEESFDTPDTTITTVVFDKSFSQARPTSTFCWFGNMSRLTVIKGIENLNTTADINMTEMFMGCNELTSLNIAKFSTSNVKRMFAMFQGCLNLKSLNIGNNDFKRINDKSETNDLFYGVGTSERPCLLIIGSQFDKSVLGIIHNSNAGGYYEWLGGYFTLEETMQMR